MSSGEVPSPSDGALSKTEDAGDHHDHDAVADEASEVESEEYSDSDEEKEPPAVPVFTGKLFCIPRNFPSILQIEAYEVDKGECHEGMVKVSNVGPDYGTGQGKWASWDVAPKSNTRYCIPYDANKVLELDPNTETFREIGDDLGPGAAKYTSVTGATNWRGCLYAAPCCGEKILEVDPATASAREVGPVLGTRKMAKWWGMVASPNGKLYALPYDAHHVLEIDPVRSGVAKEVGPDLGSQKGKYMGATLAPNGKIFAVPFNASQVLEIDMAGKVRLTGPDLGTLPRKYCCVICAHNRLLYAPPMYASKALEINCARGEVRTLGNEIGTDEAKYVCGTIASNSKIYCPPLEARFVLEIDPDYHEVNEIGADLGGRNNEKYSCIAAVPGGRMLYAAPRNAYQLLEIDPIRHRVREVGPELGGLPRKFTVIVPGLQPPAPEMGAVPPGGQEADRSSSEETSERQSG